MSTFRRNDSNYNFVKPLSKKQYTHKKHGSSQLDIIDSNKNKREVYRISEKRVYNSSGFNTSASGFLPNRPRIQTMNHSTIHQPIKNSLSQYISNQNPQTSSYSNLKSSNIINQDRIQDTSLFHKLNNNETKNKRNFNNKNYVKKKTLGNGVSSLSSKIKADLIKSKNKSSNINFIKPNKNKTILKTKQNFDKNYFKSNSIKQNNTKLFKNKTSKLFLNQNNKNFKNNFSLRGGLKKKFKNNLNESKKLQELQKNMFPQAQISNNGSSSTTTFNKNNIKHIGNIRQDKNQKTSYHQNKKEDNYLLNNNDFQRNLQESTVILNINYSKEKSNENQKVEKDNPNFQMTTSDQKNFNSNTN